MESFPLNVEDVKNYIICIHLELRLYVIMILQMYLPVYTLY